MKKRILFIQDYDPFCVGGTEGNIRGLMKTLKEMGHDPFLGFLSEKASQMVVSSSLIPIKKVSKMREVLDSFEVVVIQASPACRPLLLTASEYLISKERKFFLYFRSTTSRLPFATNLRALNGLERSVLWERFQKILRAPQSLLIANSKTTQQDLLRFDLNGKEVSVVYSSPNWGNFPLTDFTLPKKQFPKDEFKFLSISSDLSWMKGTPFLLQAFNLLVNDKVLLADVPSNKIFLDVVGSFKDNEDILGLAQALGLESRVNFLGRMNNKDVLTRLSKADCLIHASLTEALGLVLIEALGLGVPVIASDFEGMAEILENGEKGLLFERANAGALKTKMVEILNKDIYSKLTDPDIAVEIRQKFNLKNQAEQLLKIINGVSASVGPQKLVLVGKS